MKKIILCTLAMLSIATGFSQEKKKLTELLYGKEVNNSVGLTIQTGHFAKIGVFVDTHYFNEKTQKYTVNGYQLSVVGTAPNFSTDTYGTGFEFSWITKRYFSKNKNHGFYTGGGLTAGNVEFEETIPLFIGSAQYNGKYRYFSLFAPEIGYDFLIAKKVRVNLLAGTQWQIELKGKGDVDNKDFDNWVHRLGLRVSYDF